MARYFEPLTLLDGLSQLASGPITFLLIGRASGVQVLEECSVPFEQRLVRITLNTDTSRITAVTGGFLIQAPQGLLADIEGLPTGRISESGPMLVTGAGIETSIRKSQEAVFGTTVGSIEFRSLEGLSFHAILGEATLFPELADAPQQTGLGECTFSGAWASVRA